MLEHMASGLFWAFPASAFRGLNEGILSRTAFAGCEPLSQALDF